jgi:hypothetical protein
MDQQSDSSSAPLKDPYLAAYRLTHDHGRYDQAEALVEDLLQWSRQAVGPMPFVTRRANWLLIDMQVHRLHGKSSPCFKDVVKHQPTGRIPVFDDTPELSAFEPDDEPNRQAA